MIISLDQLQPDVINNIIESYVGTEGTDYGEVETSFEEKKDQVMRQLKEGSAVIVYSELHESINIIPADNLKNAC
jgi:uncharacterized protein YheU (UPF0270 family)